MLNQTEKSDSLFKKGENKQFNDIFTIGENALFGKSKLRGNMDARKYLEKNKNDKNNWKIGYISRVKKNPNIELHTKKINSSNENIIINKDIFHIDNYNQHKNTVNDNDKILHPKKPIFEILTNVYKQKKKHENLLTNSTSKTSDNLQKNNYYYNNDSSLYNNSFSNNIDNFDIYLSGTVKDTKQLCNIYDTSSEIDSEYS